MSATPLSIIVLCFNEEQMIGDCLVSAQFADEIIVVDSFSTDRTLEIARQHGGRILQHEFWSHGAQVNWTLPQAKHDWVLVLDADERVTPELAEEIQDLLRQPAHGGYWVCRQNFFLGREIHHGSFSGDWVLRLFRRDKGRYQEMHVHSQVILEGSAGRCRGKLLHYSYRSLDDFMSKGQRFVRGGALNALKRGTRGSGWRMASHALGRFVKSYFLKLGFLDGTAGLIIAFMQADRAFFKYARLWELQQQAQSQKTPTPPGP
jgi:glycosyltransferase involved in cell wall biosynthesis